MTNGVTSQRARDEEAARLLRVRERAHSIARIVVNVVALIALASLITGTVAAYSHARSGDSAVVLYTLAAVQGLVVLICVWSVLYGTQVYWVMGVARVLLAAWIESRLRRR